jgi:hypothetical protein
MGVDPADDAPAIIRYFASKEVRPGETWKIYLHARDRQGDMNRIVCLLEEPGAGPHPVVFIKIREDQRENLSGYIFLNTATAYGSPFAGCRLTVQIQDKKGSVSNPVSIPLILNPRASQEDPPLGIFQERELGPVQVPVSSTPGP